MAPVRNGAAAGSRKLPAALAGDTNDLWLFIDPGLREAVELYAGKLREQQVDQQPQNAHTLRMMRQFLTQCRNMLPDSTDDESGE